MNIGRIGHYHVPNSGGDGTGYCQKADVIKVWNDETVNLDVTDSDGDHTPHLSVVVSAPSSEKATFHLGTECPFGR
jgi:hypothetical protein